MVDEIKISVKEAEEINKKLLDSLKGYQNMITYMTGDLPIGVLCLPKTTEKILLSNGCLRVYDLFNRDLTKIKGIGKVRVRDLTASLDQFLAVS